MGKNQSASNLPNIIQSSNGSINFVSGSTLLMQISSSGAITTTGVISGSNALSASYALNSERLDNLDSTSFVFTSSYNSDSSSFSTRVTNNESTGSTLTTASASFAVVSSSYSAASGSLSTRVSKIEGNYATTGSNVFLGAQTVCANITSTGTIIAQTLNVQQVTSSIVYSSGSNTFGCQLTDVQQMTGSVRITGSLNVTGNTCVTSVCSPTIVGGTMSGTTVYGSTAICGGTVSGTTVYASTVACSPVGCFATSCATSFVGGTVSGTTIYGSTAVCSANGLLIGNGGVTATCNYLPKFTGTSTIGNSVVFDGTRALGIGTATPVDFGSGTYNVNIYDAGIPLIQFNNASTGLSSSVGMRIQAVSNDFYFINSQATGNQIWLNNGAERMRLTPSGNLQLTGDPYIYSNSTAAGTAIQAGLRLDSTNREIKFFTNDLGRVLITCTGVACFSNNVCALSFNSSASSTLNGLLVSCNVSSNCFTGITVVNSAGGGAECSRAGIAFQAYDWVQSAIWHGRQTSAAFEGALLFGTNPNTANLGVGGVCTRLRIDNNGIACFACQVCAPNFFTAASGTVSACRFYTATLDVAVNNGVFTDIFCSYGSGGVWLVSFTLNGNPGQIGYAIVGNAFGSAITLLAGATGAQTCITTSGLKLQVCQTSGANLTARVSSILLTNIIA